jgi:hypothetical protein
MSSGFDQEAALRKKAGDRIIHEESFIELLRRRVKAQYANTRLGSGTGGGCFGSILCHELHHGNNNGGLRFTATAAKWGIPVSIQG